MFDMQQSIYYQSLSDNIKEKVRDCGLIFDTETELREYVAGLMG